MKIRSKVSSAMVLSAVVLALVGTVVVSAANSSKPGDTLYPVDIFVESIQRTATFGDDHQAELEMKLLDERKDELETLEGSGDSDQIDASIEKLDEQEVRVKKQFREMSGSSSVEDVEKEKLAEKSKAQVKEHTDKLEQIQEKLREKDLEQEADEVEKVQEKYKERNKGAVDSTDPGSFSGSDVQDEKGNNSNNNKDKNKDKSTK